MLKEAATVISINSGISACARGALWDRALHLLEQHFLQPTRSTLQPTLVSFNSALSACASCQRWREVLGILRSLRRRGLLPDAISLNAAAGALEHQGCWVSASALLAEAQDQADRLLGPEVVTVSTAVDASERHRRASRVAGLLCQVGHAVPNNLRA
ncbi:unnamed protein product, partial [Symbiodinium pilosum]